MIADVLSGNNYINMNVKLAQLTNINTAVYFAEVLNIITKVCQKKKYDNNGYFKLDRKYVEKRTTLTLDEQYICDETLSNLNACLEVSEDDRDKVRVNLEALLSQLTGFELTPSEAPKRKRRPRVANTDSTKPRLTKSEYAIINLKKCIKEQDSSLRVAYENWVESTYYSKHLTKVVVNLFEDTINSFTTDLQTKLEIINRCTANAWADAKWGINALNKTSKVGTKLNTQKVATTLSDIEL